MATQVDGLLLLLMDCEAATLEHLALTKSSSKSEISRHKVICEKILGVLHGTDQVFARPEPKVIDRLVDSIRSAKERLR